MTGDLGHAVHLVPAVAVDVTKHAEVVLVEAEVAHVRLVDIRAPRDTRASAGVVGALSAFAPALSR